MSPPPLHRPPCATLPAVLLLLALVAARPALASAGYPAALRDELQLQPPAALPCTLCHESAAGGTGTVVRPLGLALQQRGLQGGSRTDLLHEALGLLARDALDSDGDGAADVDELRALRDPNASGDGAGSDALFAEGAAPAPAHYGCGAAQGPGLLPAVALLALALPRRRPRVRGALARSATAAMLLVTVAAPRQARAQQVLVLSLEGDPRGRVHAQVRRALRAQGVPVLSLPRYREAAARAGVSGPAALAREHVAQVAPGLGASLVVRGEVGGALDVRVSAPDGSERWRARLPLRRGLLTPAGAWRLVREVRAALTPPSALQPEAVAAAPAAAPAPSSASPPLPSAAGPSLASGEPARDAAAGESAALHPAGPARSLLPFWRVDLQGSTTWRRSCARPGGRSCAGFDRLPSTERQGTVLDFNRRFDLLSPALGFALQLELQPWARGAAWTRGLGAALGLSRATSSALEAEGSGATAGRSVAVSDTSLHAGLLYRHAFGLPGAGREDLPGFVGVRAGVRQRRFAVDSALALSSRRLFPTLGGELALPLARLAQVELGGEYLLAPRPGPLVGGAEAGRFGSRVSSRGWSARFGLGARLGPALSAGVRLEYAMVRDRFSGAGSLDGWTEGGVLEERVAALHWGIRWQP